MVEATRERIKVTADRLYETVKRLIHEGNVRRLIVRHQDKTIMEIPLTLAALGVAVAPVRAAIGALHFMGIPGIPWDSPKSPKTRRQRLD